MWYTKTIIVKQNPFFYKQKSNDVLIAHKGGELTVNKIDTTEYYFEGQFGAMFKSFENKHPLSGDDRYILGIKFQCTSVYKRGWRKYECWWTSCKIKTQEDIDNFKKEFIY